MAGERFHVTVESVSDTPSSAVRLRAALKRLLRSFAFKAVEVRRERCGASPTNDGEAT